MLTNSEIVEKYIVNNEKVMDAFDTITRGNPNTDDLFNDICLYFLEYDNDKLNEIIERGESDFRYFFVRIVKIQIISPRSSYHYTYRKPNLDTKNIENEYKDYFFREHDYYDTLDSELLEPTTLSERVHRIYDEKIQHQLSWYQRELFQLWVDCGAEKGSYQKMNNLTNIPVSSIGNEMREIKSYLKEQVEHELKKELNNEYRMDTVRTILESINDHDTDNTTN